MANVASAEKRNRQRIKRRARNVTHQSTMRTYIKRVRTAISNKDVKKAGDALKQAARIISKAATRGAINKKTASRVISRLTLAVRRLLKA